MIVCRKREAAPRSLLRAATASLKLVQNKLLTQFNLQTHIDTNIFSILSYPYDSQIKDFLKNKKILE